MQLNRINQAAFDAATDVSANLFRRAFEKGATGDDLVMLLQGSNDFVGRYLERIRGVPQQAGDPWLDHTKMNARFLVEQAFAPESK